MEPDAVVGVFKHGRPAVLRALFEERWP
jgi:hypothetical protein